MGQQVLGRAGQLGPSIFGVTRSLTGGLGYGPSVSINDKDRVGKKKKK